MRTQLIGAVLYNLLKGELFYVIGVDEDIIFDMCEKCFVIVPFSRLKNASLSWNWKHSAGATGWGIVTRN